MARDAIIDRTNLSRYDEMRMPAESESQKKGCLKRYGLRLQPKAKLLTPLFPRRLAIVRDSITTKKNRRNTDGSMGEKCRI